MVCTERFGTTRCVTVRYGGVLHIKINIDMSVQKSSKDEVRSGVGLIKQDLKGR